MYTERDLQDINQQFKRRLTIYAVPATLLIAAIVVSLVYRNELATELLFIALGALSIFCWGLYLSPVHAYRKYVKACCVGATAPMWAISRALTRDSRAGRR